MRYAPSTGRTVTSSSSINKKKSVTVFRTLAAPILAVLAACLFAVCVQAQEFPVPKLANYKDILDNAERDVGIFRFSRQGRVLIIDFPSLMQQGATFNRVSAFIERQHAPHDRVLREDEFGRYLEALGKTQETLSYGNNFTVGNLVVFFNLADDQGVPLNGYERALLQLLTAQKLVAKRTGFYQASDPSAVVLSIPKVGAAPAGAQAVNTQIRSSIFRHELSHAEYYVNERYAEFCRAFWREALNDDQRKGFREFFARSTYDTDIEEVVINEWQAYLMHTPDKAAFRAAMVGMQDEELEQLRQSFAKQSAANGVTLSLM